MVTRRELSSRVPTGVVTASEWAWRSLVIAAALLGVWWLLAYFSAVAVPLAVAVLLTALLTPLLRFPLRWGWPPLLATVVTMLTVVVVLGGVLTAIGAQVVREWPALFQQAAAGFNGLVEWLGTGPLGIDQARLDSYLDQFNAWLNDSVDDIIGVVASAGVGVGHFFAGAAIALIGTFFFLLDGGGIWRNVLTVVPARYRTVTARASGKGWTSLVAYMRAQVLVALVDALGMLAGALILGLPMAWALFAFTFITAFIPVVGAVLSGTIAVLLALVTHGWVSALIMLGITIAVVQTEGHFLQPILLGRAASLHPLAVLAGLAVGATLAGIVGALLVIPVLSFGVAFIRDLRSREPQGSPPASP